MQRHWSLRLAAVAGWMVFFRFPSVPNTFTPERHRECVCIHTCMYRYSEMTQNTLLYIKEFSRETCLNRTTSIRIDDYNIYYYVFIGIWYIVLPLHLRVLILNTAT